MAEHPIIVLRTKSRPDTIPGRIVVDAVKGDGYVDYKAAFGSWDLVVPPSERGPRALLLELTKITGSFAYTPDATRFHPILLTPILRVLGAFENRDDPNTKAARYASECAKDLDQRISAYILGASTKAQRKVVGSVTKTTPWSALVSHMKAVKGTTEYIDPDDMCERLGTRFGRFNGDPENAERLKKFDMPDETHPFRTIVREHALVLFEWARKRMDAELAEFKA